jgi:hypothetical protein
VLNCGWVYFWLNGRIGICVVMIVALSVTLLIMIWQFRTPRTYWELWLTKNTFGLYAGWVTAAAIVNIFVFLTASGIALPSAAITTFGVIAILAAATIGALIAWRLSNYLFPLSVAWALTAIAVKQGGNTIIVVASALGVVASLIAALSFVINLSANKQLPENE